MMPLSVLGFYGAILIWAVLIARGFSSPRRWPAIAVFGLLLLLFLNIRYLIEGAPSGIAFFISLYDFFDNLGLSRGDAPLAMTTCANNACSLWGSTFELHQTWGVAFFDRFVEAPSLRTNTLYLHLACNSIVFVLMHIQLFKPGHTASGVNHAWLGRLTMMFLTIGTVAALYLASEHDAVSPYGGIWAERGFYSMSLCVYGAAVMGARTAIRGDWERHRIWMIRFVGAMYGAFWGFRVLLVITGPLLREWESASLLISIWASAPLGLVIADGLRRHWDRQVAAPAPLATQ
jgi:hypothetical protein